MSPVERSDEFVTVGYFLAACSDPSTGSPPAELSVPGWAHAYAAFYRALGAGRPLRSFSNSLKATRDTFDGWVDSARAGWRNPENRSEPKPLQAIELAAFHRWRDEPRTSLWRSSCRTSSTKTCARCRPRSSLTSRAPKTPTGGARPRVGAKSSSHLALSEIRPFAPKRFASTVTTAWSALSTSSPRTAIGAVISPRFTT